MSVQNTLLVSCCKEKPIYEIEYESASDDPYKNLVCEKCYLLPQYQKFVKSIKKISGVSN